jgi:hypothetical protein
MTEYVLRLRKTVMNEREIPKGTVVYVTTTNGGDITAPLAETYRATYDIVLNIGNGAIVVRIAAKHIDTVEIVRLP